MYVFDYMPARCGNQRHDVCDPLSHPDVQRMSLIELADLPFDPYCLPAGSKTVAATPQRLRMGVAMANWLRGLLPYHAASPGPAQPPAPATAAKACICATAPL